MQANGAVNPAVQIVVKSAEQLADEARIRQNYETDLQETRKQFKAIWAIVLLVTFSAIVGFAFMIKAGYAKAAVYREMDSEFSNSAECKFLNASEYLEFNGRWVFVVNETQVVVKSRRFIAIIPFVYPDPRLKLDYSRGQAEASYNFYNTGKFKCRANINQATIIPDYLESRKDRGYAMAGIGIALIVVAALVWVGTGCCCEGELDAANRRKNAAWRAHNDKYNPQPVQVPRNAPQRNLQQTNAQQQNASNYQSDNTLQNTGIYLAAAYVIAANDHCDNDHTSSYDGGGHDSGGFGGDSGGGCDGGDGGD